MFSQSNPHSRTTERHIKKPFLRRLGAGHDKQMVCPADLCHQWCHKSIVLISLVELLHTVEAAAVEAFDAGILGAIYAQCNNGAFSISDKNGGNHICCSCAFCISLPDNRGFISYSSLHCWDSDMRDPPHISSCGCAVPYRKVWQAYCRLCPEADMHRFLAIFALSIR